MKNEKKYICASCQNFVDKVTYDESKDNDFCNDCKEVDLFKNPELLPEHIKAILDKFNAKDNDYTNCENLLSEMEENGYTFEFGLDAEPYNLRTVDNLKYFVYKLNHDKGQTCHKTACYSEKRAIENIMIFESCPRIAIEIKEVPKELWSMNAKTLFNKIN